MIFFKKVLLKPSRGLSPEGRIKWEILEFDWIIVTRYVNNSTYLSLPGTFFAYKSTWRLIFFLKVLLKPSRGLSSEGKIKWEILEFDWLHVNRYVNI